MQVDRIIYPVNSLGPGKRIVIWTIGCSKHCPKCSNKELWDENFKRDIPKEQVCDFIRKIISENEVDGITFTGGDPMEQREELFFILEKIRDVCDDVMVYTGYTKDELFSMLSEREKANIKELIDVLIDGRYIDELNDDSCSLRGSLNQNIYYHKHSLESKYKEYIRKGRTIQNIYYGKEIVSIGIHNKE